MGLFGRKKEKETKFERKSRKEYKAMNRSEKKEYKRDWWKEECRKASKDGK